MSKSIRDKRVHAPPVTELDSDSFSQSGSGFPPRIFTNMAASSPLSPQGGLGVSSNIEGCTRFPSAIDEEGVINAVSYKPPSQRTEEYYELDYRNHNRSRQYGGTRGRFQPRT